VYQHITTISTTRYGIASSHVDATASACNTSASTKAARDQYSATITRCTR
jgi:hypothetical protein